MDSSDTSRSEVLMQLEGWIYGKVKTDETNIYEHDEGAILCPVCGYYHTHRAGNLTKRTTDLQSKARS